MRFPLLLCAAFATSGVGCSGDGGPGSGGDDQNSLEIVDPPGDSIGIAFTESAALRVRYLDTAGSPIDAGEVAFELVATAAEETGASALSADTASTNFSGFAEITVTAGDREANFRVRVTALGAPPATFFVVVSDSGFATLELEATHSGPRPSTAFVNLEFRLFGPDELICADLDIDALPDSVLPPRAAAGFGEPVRYRNLAADRAYTLAGWGEHELGETRLAVGCTELAAEQVRVGPLLQLALEIADRPLDFGAPIAVTSTIVLPDLGADVDAALAPDPWTALACPLTAAQLMLDCSLDAAAPDGALDCNPTGSSALTDAIAMQRGPLDQGGCRPEEISPGTDSLDRSLLDALTAGPWTESDAVGLAADRAELLAGARLGSEISMVTPTSARHRLTTMTLTADGVGHELDLSASARPIVEQTSIAAAIDGAGDLGLGVHGFTLDLERAAEDAFTGALLPDRGLGGLEATLGTALAQSFEDTGSGTTGCAAVSEIACAAAGQAATCLSVPCSQASAALDTRLMAWVGAIAAPAIDITLSGTAAVADLDFDLAVDTVGDGDGAPTGSWVVELMTSTGPSSGAGVFGGQN